jgi:starch-binding outer membrane protein, SusD/RagB family
MKNLRKFCYALSVVTVMMSFGCTKQLDEVPKGDIAPVNFYKNKADFSAAINGAFAELMGGNGGWPNYAFNGPYIVSSGAEDISSRPGEPTLTQYDVFQPTLTGSYLRGCWTFLYRTIVTTNEIIEKVPSSQLSAADKKIFEGQARYIRAFCYFQLTRWFGEVPIITFANAGDAANVGQSKVIDIYNVIVGDLVNAKTNLEPNPAAKGTPSIAAARALLADVYLTMAGWPLKDASKYALARDEAKAVIDMGKYSIEPVFLNLWRTANKLTNKEFIFALYGGLPNNATHLHIGVRPGEEGGWSDMVSEVGFFNDFPAGPRKDATFWTVFADGKNTKWEDSQVKRPYIGKLRDAGPNGATFEQGRVTSNDGDGFFVVSRYAEMLLIYAEAQNMVDGSPSALSTDYVNLVRRRASANNDALYPPLPYGMSKIAFDEAVVLERKWEFAFENKRWFDLVRKEILVSTMKPRFPHIDAHFMLLPKPQVEVDLTNGLSQNPGY